MNIYLLFKYHVYVSLMNKRTKYLQGLGVKQCENSFNP